MQKNGGEMEERNLDLDDNGKIRLRKNAGVLPAEEGSPDEIIVDIPEDRKSVV